MLMRVAIVLHIFTQLEKYGENIHVTCLGEHSILGHICNLISLKIVISIISGDKNLFFSVEIVDKLAKLIVISN